MAMTQTITDTQALPEHELKQMANAIRALSMDMVQQANSGHPGAPMGMADFTSVLFRYFMNFNPQHPDWINRDRFILSNGHASALLYSVLHLSGYDLSLEELKNFRQMNSKTAGHPEYGHAPGIETTTGPLGQGVSNAVGMAIAQELMAARFGTELFNNKTYVSVGDGCLMEGISHEACELAGHLKLKNLIVLFDDNSITIDGPTGISTSSNILKRFEAYGFNIMACDGHDYEAIHATLERAQHSDRPVFIALKTHIGFGSPNKADTSGVHGSPLGDEEIGLTRQQLDWPHAPFEIPQNIYDLWQQATTEGKQTHQQWQTAFEALPQDKQNELNQLLNKDIPTDLTAALNGLKKQASTEKPAPATRKASGNCIEIIAEHMDNFISGSADLTGSNNTKCDALAPINAENFVGRYIYYGVREHAMGAIMNGLALYGGLVPAGGTFLVFSDYMRSAIRLSALMKQQAVYVLTHDSIGLGEDGPTHQPVEHLAMLRATPNVQVFRPADQVETTECWQHVLTHTAGPSVLALSRQGLPTVRTEHTDENLSAKGAYILKDMENFKGIFIATGSEVHLALEAQAKLAADGTPTRVVSMPCMDLFNLQDQSYRDEILPPNITARIAIEAACSLGWDQFVQPGGAFIGMTSFGASAPAEELYEHFDITAEAAAKAMQRCLS